MRGVSFNRGAGEVFQAHGADATGRVVFRKRLVRAKVLELQLDASVRS